jgi:tripartite-type tricarboxylate transporter receptor subunit TctC
MAMVRRQFVLAAAGTLLGSRVLANSAGATFPSRSVRLVVPYSVGLGPDIVARTLAAHLSEQWGQPVVVDNRPGAAGIVAFSELRNVAPDGHTLFIGDAGTLVVNPLIQHELPYDPARDLVPLTLLFRATFFILTGGAGRFASMRELLVTARAQPGMVTYASLGNGHPVHVAIESLAAEANVTLLQVPFKDAGTAFTAVANNDVDFTAFSWNSVAGLLKAGKLRPLAVAAQTRSSEAPEVPTLAQAGAPSVEMRPWAALVAPAQTPAAARERIDHDVHVALADENVRKRIEGAGFAVTPSTARELTALIDADRIRYAALVRSGRVTRN